MFFSKGNNKDKGKNFSDQYKDETMKNMAKNLINHLHKTRPYLNDEILYVMVCEKYSPAQILQRYILSPKLLQKTLAQIKLSELN